MMANKNVNRICTALFENSRSVRCEWTCQTPLSILGVDMPSAAAITAVIVEA
jgi:hypothetical protein